MYISSCVINLHSRTTVANNMDLDSSTFFCVIQYFSLFGPYSDHLGPTTEL